MHVRVARPGAARVRSLSKEPTTPSAARGFLDSARFFAETFARRRKIERLLTFEEGALCRCDGRAPEDLVWHNGLASASTGYSLDCSPAQQMALELVKGLLSCGNLDIEDVIGSIKSLVGGGTRPVHGAARQLFSATPSACSVHLPPDTWRQAFFVTFGAEPGLDAGGVSRRVLLQGAI